MSKLFKIEYLDKIFLTNHMSNISDEECSQIKTKYYEKPNKNLVHKNLKRIHNGGTMVGSITEYYVKDLMAKVKLLSARWSIEEMLDCNDLIRYFCSRIASSDTVYPKDKDIHTNFKTALQISGGRIVMKPSNFPMKTIDYILEKYNTNGNYYDFSCGWGVRMLSSFKNNINYYGTDPNFVLVERLNQMSKDYQTVNNVKRVSDIRCQGSELFVKEWEGKMGLVFSSPPYYCLEDYKIGEQSIKDRTYEQWLDEYIGETVKNCLLYLEKGGYFLVNVKNFSQGSKVYNIYDDIFSLVKKINEFMYIGTEKLINKKRPSSKENLDTNENIMVFQKIKKI